MYQHIVVGTDGSDGAALAVEHAASLAEMTGATLHLVQASGSPVVVASAYGNIASVVDPASVAAACLETLQPIAERLRARGIEVEVRVVADSAAAALCTTAEQLGADMIVVGSRGMTGARRFLGSVPNSVTHQATCSVLVVATT
jgi:nucleotide-binding universal stress UspA family protein